jgi:hypothetical protein
MNVYVSCGLTASRRASSSTRANLVQRDRAERIDLRRRLLAGRRVDHDDRAQARHPLADRGDLRQLGGVLAHDRAGVGVGDDPMALLGRVGLVDRHDHRADRGRGEVGIRPLGTGVGEDAHALAVLDAEIDQPERHLAHDLVQLGERDVPPLAVALVANGGTIAIPLGRMRHQVGDRLRRGCRRRGGYLHDCLPP